MVAYTILVLKLLLNFPFFMSYTYAHSLSRIQCPDQISSNPHQFTEINFVKGPINKTDVLLYAYFQHSIYRHPHTFLSTVSLLLNPNCVSSNDSSITLSMLLISTPVNDFSAEDIRQMVVKSLPCFQFSSSGEVS